MLEEVWLRQRKVLTIAGAAVVVLALIAVGIFMWHPWQREQNTGTTHTLPTTVTSKITTFKPYFYKDNLPGGYTLDPTTIDYSASEGVLFATLKNGKGNTIAFTQQGLPDNLANQTREQFQKVMGADGEAYITYQGSKMVGGLFSNAQNGKRTLTLLVANDPIEESVMSDLLRGLRPIQ